MSEEPNEFFSLTLLVPALTQKVNEAYDKICEIKTGMFEVQKTYFKNVGLKGKEKETD